MELLIKILTGTALITFIGVFICWLIPSVEDLEKMDKIKRNERGIR